MAPETTLLRQLQQELSSADFDIAAVLRKCKILARRLHSKELESWVDAELNGYPADADVPAYRTVHPIHYANFGNGYWSLPKHPISPFAIDKKHRPFFEKHSFGKGIETVKALAKTGGSVPKNELLFAIQGRIVDLPAQGLWAEIPAAQFSQIISAVATRVLDFVMDLEAENPDAGEAAPGDVPIEPAKVQQLVNNFFAPVGNVAQNSTHVHQTAAFDRGEVQQVVDSIRDGLEDLSMDAATRANTEAQLQTLEAQLKAAEPNETIVREAGRSLRTIVEGALSGAMVQVPHWWPPVLAVMSRLWRE